MEALDYIRVGKYLNAAARLKIYYTQAQAEKLLRIKRAEHSVFSTREWFRKLLDELGPIADQFEEIGL